MQAIAAGICIGTIGGFLDWSFAVIADQANTTLWQYIRGLMFLCSVYTALATGISITVVSVLAFVPQQLFVRLPGSYAFFFPLLCATLVALAYKISYPLLANKKNQEVVAAIYLIHGAVACFGAYYIGSVFMRTRRGNKRGNSPKAHYGTHLIYFMASIAIVIACTVWRWWDVVSIYPHNRMAIVVSGISLGCFCGIGMLQRFWARNSLKKNFFTKVRFGVYFSFLLVVVASVFMSVPSTINATGLGGYALGIFRQLTDFDKDGSSGLFGGGDCAPWDSSVHPNAIDIPQDNIDQNCMGGDLQFTSDPQDLRFVSPQSDIPDNVLLITIDTLRSDHLGSYGYARNTSPHLDALAQQSALFENAWSHAPSTRYAIPSILTGRYPLHIAYDTSIRGWPGLSEEAVTLAEVVQQSIPTTGAILNYWYFDKQRKMDQGFRYYNNSNKRLHKSASGQGPAKTHGSSSQQQTDAAIAFINKNEKQPFFLWVHYYDPHYDYQTHPEIPSFGDKPIDLYDQEIAFTDKHIGRLLDHLQQKGLTDTTAVVVTGDHGEGFGEHNVRLHGYHLYAAQTRVPLIVKVPGATPKKIRTPASHIDILPTVANMLDLPPPPTVMGQSLMKEVWEGDSLDERWIFQQLSYENNNEVRAAASENCHIIYTMSPARRLEVFLLGEDPTENIDRAENPGLCKNGIDRLFHWIDQSLIPEGAQDALLKELPELPATNVPSDFGQRGDTGPTLRLHRAQVLAKTEHTITVELLWESLTDAPNADWKIFIHAMDGTKKIAQADHSPPRPLAWWKQGDIVRYTKVITIPSHRFGTYDLWMGMFQKNKRLPITGVGKRIDNNRLHIGSVVIAKDNENQKAPKETRQQNQPRMQQ